MKRLPQITLAIISLGFAAFVLLNTYEIVFNKDIAFVSALNKYSAGDQVQATMGQFDVKPDAGRALSNAAYVRLERLQLPAIDTALNLEDKRYINDTWYSRQSFGHVVPLNQDDKGTTIDYLVYCTRGWQSLPEPNQIEPGMEVVLLHDGGKEATFIVEEKAFLASDKTFTAGKTEERQLILIVSDAEHNGFYGFSMVLKV